MYAKTERERNFVPNARRRRVYQDSPMLPRANRLFVLLLAVLALEIAFILPGPVAFAAGLLGFQLLPLVLRPRIGEVTRTAEGLVVVTNRTDGDRSLTAVRFWGALLGVAYVLVSRGETGLTSGRVAVGLLSLLAAAAALPMFLHRVFARRILAETIHLERTTLAIQGAGGPHVVRYVDIERIDQAGSRLSIVTSDERIPLVVGGDEEKATRVRTTIEEAARRPAGHADPLEELRRPTGMSVREWLQRLDLLAATSRAGAYRGNALERQTLWRVLADEEADRDVRTGAARILAAEAPPETRVRIAEVGKLEDIELVTSPDLDAAVTGLEDLEQKTLRRLAGV